jgi:DNA-binding response OmpR family regulator
MLVRSMSARKILLVEDNLVVAKALTMKLSHHGFLVDHVTEAAYAQAAVHNTPPDLIILDVGLPTRDPNSPVWDGLDFLEWLHWMNLPIPVIIHSITEPAKIKARHVHARASAYLQKPVRFPDLLAAIETALANPVPSPDGAAAPETTPLKREATPGDPRPTLLPAARSEQPSGARPAAPPGGPDRMIPAGL